MESIINNIIKIFIAMQKNPMRLKELLKLLQSELENLTPNNKCLGIVTSRPSNDPFYSLVIPIKYECLKNFKNVPTDYYVDIDLNSLFRQQELGGLDAREMTAWLIHELSHNILTSTAKIRLQTMLMNSNDEKLEEKYMKMLKDDTTSFFWCDIHSRTYKEYIYDDINFEADRILKIGSLEDAWNSALTAYIDSHGGSNNIISLTYTTDMDKAALKLLNTIVRENYTVRDVAYDADIQMMNRIRKYVAKNVGSKLIKQFLSLDDDKDPYVEFDEKIVNKKFDDTCLQAYNTDSSEYLHESIGGLFANKVDYNALDREIDRIGFELEDIRFVDDKISVGIEIRDTERKISKLLNKFPDDEVLHSMLEKLKDMLHDLKEIKLHKKNYGVFINPEMLPDGYEG